MNFQGVVIMSAPGLILFWIAVWLHDRREGLSFRLFTYAVAYLGAWTAGSIVLGAIWLSRHLCY